MSKNCSTLELNDDVLQAVETEDESDTDAGDPELAANLMLYSRQKRTKNSNGSSVLKKKCLGNGRKNDATEGPNSTPWLRSSSRTPGSRAGQIPVGIQRRRALGVRDSGSTGLRDDGSLLNVGKKAFSWALEKFWYPPNSIVDNETEKNSNRHGFTFVLHGEEDCFPSSMLSEENQSSDGTLASVKEDDEPDSNNANASEGCVGSDAFFTPVGSPEVQVEMLTSAPRRSILSPRISSGTKTKPRVSINQTPQVREIASRAAQARDSSLIWSHRDLNEDECANFRVNASGDTTPEADGTAYLTPFLSSPSFTKPEEQVEQEEQKEQKEKSEEEIFSKSENSVEKTGISDRLLATPSFLSAHSPPTREAALALVEFKDHEILQPIHGRPPLGSFAKVSFAEILTTAASQQKIYDDARSVVTQPRRKGLGLAPKSPFLPILSKRTRPHPLSTSTTSNTATEIPGIPTTSQATAVSAAPECRPVGKRTVNLPRLMPRQPPVTRVRPKLTVPRPCVVPAAACRPVEEMLTRKSTQWQWLPPVFADGDDVDQMDDGGPAAVNNEEIEESEIGIDKGQNFFNTPNHVIDFSESPRPADPEPFSMTSVQIVTRTPTMKRKERFKEKSNGLVDEIYARLQERLRNAVEAKKARLQQHADLAASSGSPGKDTAGTDLASG